MPRLALHAVIILSTVTALRADDYFPPTDSDGGWRTAASAQEVRERAGWTCLSLSGHGISPSDAVKMQRCLWCGMAGWLLKNTSGGRAATRTQTWHPLARLIRASPAASCSTNFETNCPQGLATPVFTEALLPEAFPLDDPRKSQITLGQLLCMSAGYWGEGGSPTGVVMGKPTPLKAVPGQDIRNLDMSSVRVPLWIDPGAGYSYSSPSPHIASIVLRHVTGMELQDYIRERLAKPMGWGPWGYCLHRGDYEMPHANGAGSIAVHATDALRFGYCLLHEGRWGKQQLVPADYIALCHQPSPFNPHTPFSLQFEHNADGHVAGAPRDAFYKSGAGGFGIFIVPSLDLVIYKMGGNNGQYEPALTGLPQPAPDTSRDGWTPIPRTPFHEGSLGGDDGLRRVLEMVSAAARD
jgi:hypothetical protein